MTEMVSGSPQTGGEAAGPSEDRPQVIRHGLTVERIFTTPGIHPYDEVSWERRDVVQTNWKTGESVFEQRGVEFPDFWSVIASTIVTTKYFRGAVGSDNREWSLRQLIDRVVRSYRRAGEDHGYFATPTDAEIFDHELTWMLLHQVFSFNSPVWFNVGTPAPQQVSACFILAVDDSMTSILNWYKEEGMIFKGGSGAGLNLSRIRSSKELLSSGGTASGPVSFMRGADASAGTIKSGGATRRAAKMVVLDVDHPDIEEFIETKAREEDKIRALRDAGFDMDLGGKDITSVQYQNANNSVRVSDEFMQSVEEGREFALRARADGSVVESVDAKGLFGKIALAAWRCADPGMQYDDTINDWHTSPETGRITASNPCFTGDTLVHTDKGLIQFDELLGRANGGEEFQVWTHDATNPDEPATRAIATTPEAYMITGYNPIIRLGFTNGMELKCTPSHRIWTTNRGYVEAENLSDDDQVLTSDVMTPAFNAADRLPNAALVEARALGESHDEMNLPTEWSYELAHYLGWLIGDGSTSQTVSTIYGSQQDRDEILPMHHEFIESINGGRPLKISEQGNGTAQLRLARGAFRRFLEGLGVTRAVSADKRVPSAILQAPPEFVGWFLQGLFDADGTAVLNEKSGSYVSLGSVSRDLLRDVQRLLSTFGISSRISLTRQARVGGYKHKKPDGTVVEYDSKTSYQLRISRENVERFAQFVNFRLGAKAAVLRDIARSRTPRAGDPTTRLESRTDEGIQLTYNLSEPRNHSYIANGIVVRNCSEYMHLDNSSCNLASINLLKFLREDDTFDADKFAKVVEMVITAMDISICFADFPTEAIGDTTRKYRQLGIGYANLGALLMASGLAYDSDGGRALAASITSLMTGAAYKRSAELSAVVGPYEGYARNAEAHKRVMRKHASATDSIRMVTSLDKDVHLQATQVWADVLRLGESNGFRNAQASVLAPTGTIGLMMDCDTTGIEPDLALVKFKKLVGGGSLQIVNQTVPRALHKLGYTEETVEAIVEHISQHGNVIDAPGLKPEHYGIFDCAMGARTIAPMGHVRMMAAVQPFLSGAISKTVNMAETATVEEIEEIYFQGWKLGLKALAIYRDNCKVGQPLSDAKGTSRDNGVKAEEAAQVPETRIEYRPTRKRLPKNRPATTTSFSVGGAEGYMTASRYPDDGLGEIFLKMSKQGSTLAGMMDAFSIAVSIGLQYGVPLDTFVQKFVNMRFDPAGLTDDPDVRMAQSIMDYIFRRLALDYMPFDERAALGIYTADERKRYLETGSYEELDDESQADVQAELDTLAQSAPVSPHVEAVDVESEGAEGVLDEQIVEHSARPIEAHSSTELLEALQGTAADAPLCMTCGTKMRPAGSCYVCEGCGATSGCS